MTTSLSPDVGSSGKFTPELIGALIAELKRIIPAMVEAAMAKSDEFDGPSPAPLGGQDPASMQYRRRRAQTLVARAKSEGVKLGEDDALELLDRHGKLKFGRRAKTSKQASEKAFQYCEAQREFNRRHVPFREAFAYYLGYRAAAP